jgi:hypothetical protein
MSPRNLPQWPEPVDFDMGDTPPWERQSKEPTRQYGAFRLYRDMSPAQRSIEDVARQIDLSIRRTHEWAVQWSWKDRAQAWDDACHHIEDQERLEAIRSMHAMHRRAGRAAIVKAVQALNLVQPDAMPIGAIARLLALGAKLERDTLIVSVEELQGLDVDDDEASEDPWERIAAELDPHDTVDLP